MIYLRPNEQRAKIAILLIWIMLALEIVSLISGMLQYVLLQNLKDGVFVSNAAATANDLRESAIGIIYFIAYIISAITFIMWFRRAYYNLHQKVEGLSNTEGWAAGAWFVPIISLFKPYQIMKEMYEKTKSLLVEKGMGEGVNLSTGILGIWWALWIISNLIGQFSFRFTMDAETLDDYLISTMVSLIMNVIGIPLALITVKVIKNYSEIEHKLREIPEENIISDNPYTNDKFQM